MKSHPTKQIIILFAVIVFILLGLHYFVFRFIKNTGVEVLTLERDVASMQAQVLEFSKYTPEDLSALAQSVSARFISKGDFVDFIQTLETKGRSQNLAVTVRSVATEIRNEDNPGDDKEILRLQLETVGSWANTLRFINYLEHLPYKITVHKVRLTNSPNTRANDTPTVDDSGSAAATVPSETRSWKAEIEITVLKLK